MIAATTHPLARVALGLLASIAFAAPTTAAQPDPDHHVKVVVLLENNIGGTRAQGYIDRLLEVVAKECRWPEVSNSYATGKGPAVSYIEEERPQLGLFSLGAFLALESAHRLEVVGQAYAAAAGGRQYFVVTRDGARIEDCQGERLVSNHLDDARFIDNVVFAGHLRLDEFEIVRAARPVQPLRMVMRGEAHCALIDDAQRVTMANLADAVELREVWASAPLPPMPIVHFPNASPRLVAGFRDAMPRVCRGEGQAVCSDAGLEGLRPASAEDYQALIRAYREPEVARP